MENERADAGRDGRTPVSRDQIRRRERGEGKYHFSCSADHEQEWQPSPVDPYSAESADNTFIIPSENPEREKPQANLIFLEFFLYQIGKYIATNYISRY